MHVETLAAAVLGFVFGAIGVLASGFDAHVTKPADLDQLQQLIARSTERVA